MAKNKQTLEVEYEYDFSLIGISCSMRDYRLCWSLNKELQFNLKKEDDIELKIRNKGNPILFSRYSYNDDDQRMKFLLIANRGTLDYLVPEQKKADYLFMIEGNISDNGISELINKLKQVETVQLAFKINIDSLKSKQNLLF